MNKIFTKPILSAFLALSAAMWAHAEIVENYSYDFSKPIDTEDHAFAVASGWGHVVESYTEGGTTYWQPYTYSQYSGRTAGALNIGNEEVGGNVWNKKKVNDIIVTPKVSGRVSMWMKSTSYSSYGGGGAKFYAMKKLEDGTYVQGEEYTDLAVGKFTTTWQEIVFENIEENAEYPYIGIHATQAYLCDLSAEKADIDKQHKLSVLSVTTNAPSSGIVCDENDNVNLTLTAEVANVGDYSYGEDTENLTLAVYLAGNDEPLKVLPIGAIAEGAKNTVNCVLDPIPFSEIGSSAVFTVRENLSGNSRSTSPITVKEYVGIVTFRVDTYNDVPADYVLDLGRVNAPVDKKMYLSGQKGTAPATITSVECPVGFTTSLTELPVVIPTTGRTDITFSFDPEGLEPGVYTGEIVLTLAKGEPARLPVKVEVIDPSLIFLPFTDNSVLPGDITNLNSSNLWRLDYSGSGSSRNNYIRPTSSYSEAVLVLPKLTFSADHQLTVDAKYSSRSTSCTLKFAYSPDRTTWTELPEMTLTPYTENPLTSDFQTFTVTGVPEGDYFIRISGREACLDNIYGLPYAVVAHDVELSEIGIPAAGMVNNLYTASVTVRNYKHDAEEAGSYNVVLVAGDKEFVADENPEIPGSNGTASFEISFTPHQAGELPMHIELRFNDEAVFATSDVAVAIEEERINARHIITPEKNGSTGNGYVLPVSRNARVASEQIFPASYINLPAGTKISGITFMGCNPGDEYTTHLEAWVKLSDKTLQNTEATTPLYSTDEMTKVFDGDYTFAKTSFTDDWFFNIPFDSEFVYDGESSLVVFLRAVHPENETASNIQFANYNDGTSDKWKRYRRWFLKEDGSLGDTDNWNLGYAALDLVVATGSVTGHVTEGELPVEGALVTLRSGDVEYYGTSDAEGAYAVEVLQASREYTADVQAEDLSASEGTVSFAEELDQTLDFPMLVTKLQLQAGTHATITLPDVTVAPAGKYYFFYGVEGSKLVFHDVNPLNGLQPHIPYIIIPAEDCEVDLSALTFADVADAVTVETSSFTGTYSSRILRENEYSPISLISVESDTPAAQSAANVNVVPAAGAYLVTDIANPSVVLRDVTSGINGVGQDTLRPSDGSVYTPDGRLVRADGTLKGLPAGIYIVNGEKIYVR